MIRYRAMVPMIYLWRTLEFLGRHVVLGLYPIERVPAPSSGSVINPGLVAVLALGLALSIWPRRGAPGQPAR